MNLAGEVLPFDWTLLSLVACLFACLYCLRHAPWRSLLVPEKINAALGGTLAVAALWLLKAGVQPNLNLHLLGAAPLTLLLGPWFALLALAADVLILSVLGQAGWADFGLNWLIMGLVPVGVTQGLFVLARRFLPAHFLVYIFINAFLAGALSIIAVGVAASLLLGVAGAYPWDELAGGYFAYFLLLSFGEAFLCGMALTVIVIYRPQWASSFDDNLYLNGK